MSTEKPEKCTVKDGRFVIPCGMLDDCTDRRGSEGSRKGLVVWPYTNMNTRQPSRTLFGAKTDKYPNGVIFNFCPWCGEKIDAPALDAEKTLDATK